jgi:hypothetical protein
MKTLLKILILLIFSSFASAEVKVYENTYENIRVGVTPIHELLDRFGKPTKITEYNNNIHYQFSGVKVTALKNTGRVSTISINKRSYVDSNGIKMGATKAKLESKFGLKINKNFYADQTKGIVYWLKNDRVEKIVLVRNF